MTSQAANNVDTKTGSNVDVQTSQREAGQLDALTTEHNAILQNYGYRTAAQSDEAQAGLDEAESVEAPIGAGLSATGTFLSSASSLASKWNSSTFGDGGGGGVLPGGTPLGQGGIGAQ